MTLNNHKFDKIYLNNFALGSFRILSKLFERSKIAFEINNIEQSLLPIVLTTNQQGYQHDNE